MIDLFSHNQTACVSAVETLTVSGKAAIAHPTGTGKSFIAVILRDENKYRDGMRYEH